MDDNNLKDNDDVIKRVEPKLKFLKVKLWREPYYCEGTGVTNDNAIKELAENFIKDDLKNVDIDSCINAIKHCQMQLVAKLQEKNEFFKTGIATLHVKQVKNESKQMVHIFKVPLTIFGSEFRQMVAKQFLTDAKNIKLIFDAKTLMDDKSLLDQGVQFKTVFLTIVHCPNKQVKDDDDIISKTKKDINILLKTNNQNNFFNIEDQSGRSVDLKDNEKQCLITAMTFHQKGHLALKNSDYSNALLLLLEADYQFKLCGENSKLLKLVDNYALLNLDIVWCYLLLKSFNQLPDAQTRLIQCEQYFSTSYGPNYQRLMTLKPNRYYNEMALIMRLHLLQGIVYFYQNQMKKAREYLEKAQQELNDLKIDEQALQTLIDMKFTLTEARLGLRATKNNVANALEYIMQLRNERLEARRKVQLEQKNRKLGKCADGVQFVNSEFVEKLCQMGYTRSDSIEALKQTDNNLNASVQLISEFPEKISAGSSQNVQVDIAKRLQLIELGYDFVECQKALVKHKNHLDRALDDLINNNGVIFDVLLDNYCLNDDKNNQATCSKRQIQETEAKNRLSEDIGGVEDDEYLDLTLDEEQEFLNQFKQLISQYGS